MALLALCHISLWDDQGIKINDIFEDPQNGPAWLSVRDCCLLVFLNTAFTFKVVTVHRRHVRQELSLDRHFKITYWMNCTRSSESYFFRLCIKRPKNIKIKIMTTFIMVGALLSRTVHCPMLCTMTLP